MSWQMYPMASSVDSFMCSVLDGSVTLATSWGISSGHWLTGISAQAIPATHCEAELGRYVSVPKVCSTCRGRRAGLKDSGGGREELRPTKPEDSHVVLDLAAEACVDGQPSLLVLGLHVGVLGGQGVLHLQPGRHAGHLGVAWVGQHLG